MESHTPSPSSWNNLDTLLYGIHQQMNQQTTSDSIDQCSMPPQCVTQELDTLDRGTPSPVQTTSDTMNWCTPSPMSNCIAQELDILDRDTPSPV